MVVVIVVGGIASAITVVGLGWAMIGALARKPRVRLSFYRDELDDGDVVLGCEIINDPIYAAPLTWLGMKRNGFDDVWCLFWIASVTSGEVFIGNGVAALHDRKGGHHSSAPLPASPFGLRFPVAVMGGPLEVALTLDGKTDVVLPPDTYTCAMFVHADELHVEPYAHRFTIGADQRFVRWVGGLERLKYPLIKRLWTMLWPEHNDEPDLETPDHEPE